MIDILMTTYNGQNYLTNQILSLQQQTFCNWRLIIRDDGSTDETINIIKKFTTTDRRIIYIEDTLGNLGPGKSFIELTRYADADYVMYCDQDDIWFEKKIEILHKYADVNLSRMKPGLVYCDGYAYSDNLGTIISTSISKVHASSLQGLLFLNAGYQGCSMLFNRKLCAMLCSYQADYFYMHDDVTTLLAHTFGDVFFVNKALMLYRQHDKNVTGNIPSGFFNLFKRLSPQNPILTKEHYEEKKSFYNAYNQYFDDSQKKIYEDYLLFPHVGYFKRLQIVFFNRFSEGGNFLRLLIKVLIRKPIDA